MTTRFIPTAAAVVALLLLTMPAPAQEETPGWKLKPDEYAAYSVSGMMGIKHIGFFGYDIVQGRVLRSEPAHPAFLSLPVVTLIPNGKLRKGMKVPFTHTFTHFECYTPVKVSGFLKVVELVGPLLFLEGRFNLIRARASGRDGRFYQVTGGKLNFTSQFDLSNGWLKEAVVKYTYVYDARVAMETLYTGVSVKQMRGQKAMLHHEYAFDGVIQKSEMQDRIDAYVDETAQKLLEDWGGDHAEGHNYALKTGYDSLYVLALLHAKVPKNNAVVQKAVARIREGRVNSTYSAALMLMALEAINTSDEELRNPDAYRDKQPKRNLSSRDKTLVERAVQYLAKGQLGGGWTYIGYNADKKFFPNQFGPADNSNSQFALMGLFAAARMGVKVNPRIWRKAISHWKRHAMKKGYKPRGAPRNLSGWAYEENRGSAYLSMTAGGLASLAIIRAGLGIGPDDRSRDSAAIDRLRMNGMAWLDYFYSVRQCRRARLVGPDQASDWAYHLYSIERACDLGRIKKIGIHDWYLEGAMAILNGTYEDIGRDHVFEALCLLFLRRSSPAAVTPGVK